MPSPFSLFSRKKPSTPFKTFFTTWSKTLTSTLLPHLRHSLTTSSSAASLSSQTDHLLRHLISYYDALDLSSTPSTISILLFPSSLRNPLETPFLFLGDLHPYIFTNLVRSFVERENHERGFENDGFKEMGVEEAEESRVEMPWKMEMAWKDPSEELMSRIGQIECTMRLMIPELVLRVRKAQRGLVERVAEDYVISNKKKVAVNVEDAVMEVMEEMVSIFVDANRLRRSVIMDIVSATSEYQGALFLAGLAQFLVGFRDPALLEGFEQCLLAGSEEGSSFLSA